MSGFRPARIDSVPGLKEEVARAYAENATQEEIASIAGVSDRGTVAAWLKREDVQALISKYVQERSNRIVRSTDTKIEAKLNSGVQLSMKELLEIRKTFMPQQVKIDMSGEQAGILEKFLAEMHEDPDAAEKAAAALRADADPD